MVLACLLKKNIFAFAIKMKGDAENDLEMLQDAAIGVAVNNAVEMCKDAADVVMPLTSTEGGAGLALEVILGI